MKINYHEFIKQNEAQKKETLGSFYHDVLSRNRDEQVQLFINFLENISKVTDDQQYENICRLSMEVFLSLKDVNLRDLMAVRLEAQFELPDDERMVDSMNLLRAIESMPEKDILLDMIKSIER